MKTPLRLRAWLALPLSLFAVVSWAAGLVAGPMVGPTATRAATVWVQGKADARARIEFWPQGRKSERRLTAPVDLSAEADFTGHLGIDRLEPGTRYEYRVLLNGKPGSAVHELATQKLWQWRADPPEFKVLVGSCVYINETAYDRPGKAYGGSPSIFTHMAEAKPDLTLWLGDSVYFREVDYDSPAGMAARWRHDRSVPELQPLLATGSHAAIWDDHDYGTNDADASFVFKEQALRLFERYWANPGHGQPDAPGVYTRFRHGDAEFFLLDDRWYRDADKLMADHKVMFGERQLRWLKNALVNSTATFKFIAGGSQLLDTQSPYEGWRHFAEERQGFIDWLTTQGIKGVVFLSGDRHHTEMLRWPRADTYALHELTCSPLTSGTHSLAGLDRNPGLVEGTLVGERNFCTLDFTGSAQQRTLVLKSFSADGRELWRQELRRTDLGYRDSTAKQ